MTTQNFRIDSISPIIRYDPPGVSEVNLGWTSVQGSDASTNGSHTSYRATSSPNAHVQFSFFGTGLKLFGELPSAACSYKASVDMMYWTGGSQQNLLAEFTNLPPRNHDALISVSCAQGNTTDPFRFDYAMVDLWVGDLYRSPTQYIMSNTNASLVYRGTWGSSPDLAAPLYSNTSRYTQTIGDIVSLSFVGTAIAIYGSAQRNHGAYNSSLDGAIGSYNASSPFSISPALLFLQAGLDPNVTHRLNLTHADPQQAFFDIDSVVIYNSVPDDSPKHSNSLLPTILAIICSIIGVIAIGLNVLFRHSSKRHVRRARPMSLDLRELYPPYQAPGHRTPVELLPIPFVIPMPNPVRLSRVDAIRVTGSDSPSCDHGLPLRKSRGLSPAPEAQSPASSTSSVNSSSALSTSQWHATASVKHAATAVTAYASTTTLQASDLPTMSQERASSPTSSSETAINDKRHFLPPERSPSMDPTDLDYIARRIAQYMSTSVDFSSSVTSPVSQHSGGGEAGGSSVLGYVSYERAAVVHGWAEDYQVAPTPPPKYQRQPPTTPRQTTTSSR